MGGVTLPAATVTMQAPVSTRPARAVRDCEPLTARPSPAHPASPHVYISPGGGVPPPSACTLTRRPHRQWNSSSGEWPSWSRGS